MDESQIRASIAPANERLPVDSCIRHGLVRVNLPVATLMILGFGGGLAVMGALKALTGWQGGLAILLFVFLTVGGWCAAWAWWSWTIPKWRLWALRNVDDWKALKKAAVKAGLTWPDGHVFEKTEIKSTEQRKVEQILRRIRDTEG